MKAVVHYTDRRLAINVWGEVFHFNLNDGDTGELWDSFTTKDGRSWDVCFHQEDEDDTPTCGIYSLSIKGDYMERDGKEEIDLEVSTIGDPDLYFNHKQKYLVTMEDVYREYVEQTTYEVFATQQEAEDHNFDIDYDKPKSRETIYVGRHVDGVITNVEKFKTE